MPATLAVIFASSSLFRAIFRSATPAALDPALARLPNVISPVPSMLDTVPLLKPELSLMSFMVALMSSIVTGPTFSPVAVMWTSLKSRAASWVRNGKPWIDTSGLELKPCFWIWVANSLSAKRTATRSTTTNRTASTTTITIRMTGQRRRAAGGRGSGRPRRNRRRPAVVPVLDRQALRRVIAHGSRQVLASRPGAGQGCANVMT